MTTRLPDRRVARTRELVLDAFRDLMVEKGYEQMTVQHLLDRAGVGRATFYAHFRNKEELLASSIRRLQGGLREACKRAAEEQRTPGLPLGFAREFLRHVDGHRRIYHLMVGRPSEVTIDRYMRRMLAELVREDLATQPGRQSAPKNQEVAVQFATGALWSLLHWWISTRTKLSADDLYAQFRRLAMDGLGGTSGRGSTALEDR